MSATDLVAMKKLVADLEGEAFIASRMARHVGCDPMTSACLDAASEKLVGSLTKAVDEIRAARAALDTIEPRF